ncbi:purine nucleoside phosphorylase [Ktedonobacteria bacterium brp13]|nr:purine nucleoside phosphorylase [Ktedonobacteria bacterium brp13]
MSYEQIVEATDAIRRHTEQRPQLAIILGSGLGELATEIQDAVAIPYAEIPHFAESTVAGHAGQMVLGTLEGVSVVVLQGRFHTYEGHSAQVAAFPVQVMRQLGAEALIVTNAAGGVNPDYRPGHFMLLRDHINFPGMAGHHPLVGPNDERLGPRFPALAKAYDAELRAIAHSVAARNSEIVLHEGIYTMVTGPSFETPAELRFLRIVGTDAVGMSTVPEVIVARHMGMRVLGISLITNQATGDENIEVNHAEVLATADMVGSLFSYLVHGIVREYAAR